MSAFLVLGGGGWAWDPPNPLSKHLTPSNYRLISQINIQFNNKFLEILEGDKTQDSQHKIDQTRTIRVPIPMLHHKSTTQTGKLLSKYYQQGSEN